MNDNNAYLILEDDGDGTNMQANGDLEQLLMMIGDAIVILARESKIEAKEIANEIAKYVELDEESNVSTFN